MDSKVTSSSKVSEEAQSLISYHKLQPHPEGGYFAETYRSKFSTAIHFLITPGNVSHVHILTKSDEIWHFYKGDPMTVVELDEKESNHYRLTVLGPDHSKGHVSQYAVKAGTWFGSLPNEGSKYSFVGCTVAPAFTFDQFKLATKEVYKKYPKARQFLEKYKLIAS
ncbi:hypothetical protein AAMO2058_000846800 [Amorphochlora amoebiformis]